MIINIIRMREMVSEKITNSTHPVERICLCLTYVLFDLLGPCIGKIAGTLPMNGYCSGFWACLNGTAIASCCPTNNRAYTQGVGCTNDPSCLLECPPKDNRIVGPTGKSLFLLTCILPRILHFFNANLGQNKRSSPCF